MLPRDFPNWPMIYYYFNTWKKSGLIAQNLSGLSQAIWQSRDLKGLIPFRFRVNEIAL
jgi:hypothetical protein